MIGWHWKQHGLNWNRKLKITAGFLRTDSDFNRSFPFKTKFYEIIGISFWLSILPAVYELSNSFFRMKYYRIGSYFKTTNLVFFICIPKNVLWDFTFARHHFTWLQIDNLSFFTANILTNERKSFKSMLKEITKYRIEIVIWIII